MNRGVPQSSEPSAKPDAAWIPPPGFVATTNIASLMRQVGADSYDELHAWSVRDREAFWALAIERLGIRFERPYSQVADFSAGPERPSWLVDARLNIVESCFAAPADSPAIVYQAEGGEIGSVSVGGLRRLTDLVAANLARRGFKPGDRLAIIMPMTVEAVAIYLGIVKAGCVVVGIADSFRPKEIAARLRLSEAVTVFTQDVMTRGGKSLPLYANVREAEAPTAVVVAEKGGSLAAPLRPGDCDWRDFLQNCELTAVIPRDPDDHSNILFSSGTTGEPKAIPWTHTTPIKCATDAHFHQNVQPGDLLVWPTNLGWMMGPWLIFASLINKAALGLYYGAPTGREFGCFVQNSKTTMLGVVPSLVKTWRSSACLQDLDWSAVKLFSSTGECSCPDDMRWLMTRGPARPMIEYCGGTEIGGGYITGTVTKPCVPGAFNTPALGLDVVLLDENQRAADSGEMFLVPPSIGMSKTLLNKDHHEAYYADVPSGPRGELLRRHGDQMERLPGGYWRALGRADDTMNLGGIKISSAEIERVLRGMRNATEVAAIAVSPPNGGPSQLVIYAVCDSDGTLNKEDLLEAMRGVIKRELNPLFKIHDVILVAALPRTASNKIMRRTLRENHGARI